MNDFDYDCMQRKRLARQDFHRKRGSKSRKCSLPSDHLTPKQWRERCGKIVTIQTGRPIEWKVFKELSKDTQEEYLRDLQDTYHASAVKIAEMFGVSPATVRKYIQDSGLNVAFRVGSSMDRGRRAAWEKFLRGEEDPGQAECAAESENAGQMPVTGDWDGNARQRTQMAEFSLLFTGVIDPGMIANSIRSIAGDGAVGEVQIVCRLNKEAQPCTPQTRVI